jgi:hypothetical protein
MHTASGEPVPAFLVIPIAFIRNIFLLLLACLFLYIFVIIDIFCSHWSVLDRLISRSRLGGQCPTTNDGLTTGRGEAHPYRWTRESIDIRIERGEVG